MRRKKILIPVAFVCLVVIGFVVYQLLPTIYQLPLLSPLGVNKRPDLTAQLSAKTSQLGTLDYSTAKTISTISDSISYLAYNPKTLKVYSAKDQNTLRSPGSFVKLLTAQVVLDLVSSDERFTVPIAATQMEPTILGLKENEKLSVSELLRGAISTSANDAAFVLGDGINSYYRQDSAFFPELMNQKAQLLGMTSSHFANPHGFDDDLQYSTLADIAKLINNTGQNYPEIVTAGRADREDIKATSTNGFYYLPNWNGLLGVYPTVNGLKIAYTAKSGYSTIVTANRNNIPVVAIVAGADSIRERDLAAAAVLDEAYMQEHLSPVKVRASQVNLRYATWAKLATQIRAEIKAREASSSAK